MTEVRPLGGDDDLAAWVAVNNEVAPVPVTTGEVQAYRDALAGNELHLLARAGGAAVGAGLVAVEAETAEAWICVLPGSRRRGVGRALYEHLSEWGRQAGLELLEGQVDAAEAEGLAWAGRRGFEEVGRETKLALDLQAVELPDAVPPAGVEIAVWADRPELAGGIYAVACEAYADVPGRGDGTMASFEEWLALDMGGPNDRPEAVFVALADGEVVGYSKLHLSDARPTVAANDMTGVLRAWRGRGVAGALKHAQLAWARANGYERLETANETRNIPIQRLNERLGYRPFAERVLLRGPLAPQA
jgi:GNAT superfamily N-acetyltransferase